MTKPWERSFSVPGVIEPMPNTPQKIVPPTAKAMSLMNPAPATPRAEQQRQAMAMRDNPFHSALTAMGKEVTDLGYGLGMERMKMQRMLGLDSIGNRETEAKLRSNYEEGNRLFEPIASEHPVATMAGQSAPYALPAFGLNAMYRGARLGLSNAPRNSAARRAIMENMTPTVPEAALGATAGYLHPDMDPVTGAIGGAVGGAIGGRTGQQLARRPAEFLTEYDREMIDYAKEIPGFKLLPGDLTRLPQYMREDKILRDHPKAQIPYLRIERDNTELLNSRVFRATGMEDTANITSDVIEELENDLSDQYSRMISESSGKFDDELVNRFVAAENGFERETGAKSKILKHYGIRLSNYANENLDISGKDTQTFYKDLTSQIRKKQHSAADNAKTEAKYLRQMRNALVDNVEKGLPDDIKGNWKKLRSNYAATRLLLDNKVVNDRGDVNFIKLRNALQKKENIRNYQKTSGPWQEMIKAAKVGAWRANKPSYPLTTKSGVVGGNRGVRRALSGLVFGKGAQLPYLGRAMSYLYRHGYPHITGYANMNAQTTPRNLGILTGNLGFPASREIGED